MLKVLRFFARYSPPLFPILIGFSEKLLGLTDWAAIAVSAALGTLTVQAMYALGKKLYGLGAGLLSALFVAVSPYHVIYSRMALTDATFLFFFLIALTYFYDALKEDRPRKAVFAGIAAGLAMNTKYSGPLVLLIGLVANLFLLGRGVLPARWRGAEYNERSFDLRSTVSKTALFLLTGGALYVPWLLTVATDQGYRALVNHQVGYTALSTGAFVRTPPMLVVHYFTSWTSPYLLLLGLTGLAIALARRKTPDIFLLTYLSLYSAGVMLYSSYPRLALPLLPGLALLAANGIIALWQGSRGKTLKVAILVVASLATLDLLRGSALLLSVKTDGYRQAAQFITQQLPKKAPVFQKMQMNFNFYTQEVWELRNHPEIRQGLAYPGSKYFVFDQTLTWDTFTDQLFELNRDHLRLVTKISNASYDEVYLQPATLERFRRLAKGDIPDEYRYIYIYAADQPMVLSQ
jgi:4-amino-4-deoxy-L-arabinose transferase-like glycosyltransferase